MAAQSPHGQKRKFNRTLSNSERYPIRPSLPYPFRKNPNLKSSNSNNNSNSNNGPRNSRIRFSNKNPVKRYKPSNTLSNLTNENLKENIKKKLERQPNKSSIFKKLSKRKPRRGNLMRPGLFGKTPRRTKGPPNLNQSAQHQMNAESRAIMLNPNNPDPQLPPHVIARAKRINAQRMVNLSTTIAQLPQSRPFSNPFSTNTPSFTMGPRPPVLKRGTLVKSTASTAPPAAALVRNFHRTTSSALEPFTVAAAAPYVPAPGAAAPGGGRRRTKHHKKHHAKHHTHRRVHRQ